MRDLSKPLAETFPTRKKRTKRRTTVKTPTYELGSNKRLAMNKNTVTTDKKGNLKKSRGVSKSGGKKTVSKTNYKTGKEVNRTRKTVGSVVRGAARKAGVGQKKGQRSLATAPTTRGELGYKVRK